MSPDEMDPGHEWPLPPPWMWDCDECASLYRTMRNVGDRIAELRLTGERGVDWDPFDSTVTTQIALGAHLAARHRDLLPDWDPACETCARHQERIAHEREPGPHQDLMVRCGGEHLARHVYAPPRTVGLL
ncbi:hypothetical protein ACFUGD_11910 [Streptomyces sp. NPDC057217]|uniref:hypothetical protein n=1 Tax=Streptomyces sp. NPDC057217 TaxID=3346054 RepID=UPI003626860B